MFLHDLDHLTSAAPAQGDAAAPVPIIVDHHSLFPTGAQDILNLLKIKMWSL